jgi:hypothetical protein
MEGPIGFDLSHALWRNDGWREMRELRKKLENLRELRDLIRKLGRASGKGPKRRAPQEVCPPPSKTCARASALADQFLLFFYVLLPGYSLCFYALCCSSVTVWWFCSFCHYCSLLL